MAFSAGTIFLQVVPSFRGVQQAARKEARKIGDAFEEGFDEGVGDLDKVVEEGLRGSTTKAKVAGGKAGEAMGGEFARLLKVKLEAAVRALPKIKLDADSSDVDRELAQIRASMQALNNAKIGVDVTSREALEKLRELQARLEHVRANSDLSIQADMDSAAALAQLHAVFAATKALSGDVNIDVEVDGAAVAVAELEAVATAQRHADRATVDSGNAFRAFNPLLLLSAGLGAGLIPVLAGVAGGLALAGTSALGAGSGLGVAALGFSGIGDAVSALGAQQEALAQLQRGVQGSLTATGAVGTAAARKVQTAFDKLGPAGARFARFLFGLRGEFLALRNVAQTGMLPGVQEAITRLIDTYGPRLTKFVGVMSRTIGDLFVRFSEMLTNPAWQAFFDTMAQFGPIFLTQFAQIGGSVLTIFANLATALAPFSAAFGANLAGLAQTASDFFAVWLKSDAFQAFMGYLAEIGPRVGTFFGQLVVFIGRLAVALAPLGGHLLDALIGFLEFLNSLSIDQLRAVAIGVLGLMTAFQVGSGLTAAIISIQTFFALPAAVFAGALVATGIALYLLYQNSDLFRGVIDKIMPTLKSFWEGFVDALPVIKDFAIVIGSVGLAFLVYAGYLKAVALATTAWAIAQYALNTALAIFTAPVTLIVLGIGLLVGALVLAYTKSETFRDIVQGALRGIGTAWSWLWENVLKPGFAALVEGWGLLVDGFQLYWERVLKPVFVGIGAVFSFLWNSVLKPIFGFIGAAWNVLVTVIQFLWERILKPVFTSIGNLVSFIWTTILRPIFQFIGVAFQILVAILKLAWDRVGHPLFTLVGTIVRLLWATFIKPALDAIGTRWSTLMSAMRVVWDKVGKPLFDLVKLGASALSTAFKNAVTNIGGYWAGLKKTLATPVIAAIKIINDGIISPFNSLAKSLGVSATVTAIPVPSWLAAAAAGPARIYQPTGFATGGIYDRSTTVIPGYTPGRDTGYIGVGGGEAIMRPEFTRAVGSKFVNEGNAAARSGGVDGVKAFLTKKHLGNFASGGVVAFGRLLQSMGFSVGEHPLFGGVAPVHVKNSLHYSGNAIDVNWRGGGSEKANIDRIVGLARQYALRTIWQSAGHYDHAHFDTGRAGAMGDIISSVVGGLGRVGDIAGGIKAKVTAMIADKLGGAGQWGKIVAGLPLKVADWAGSKISSLLSAAVSSKDGSGGVMTTPGFGGNAGGRRAVAAAAETRGWGPSSAQWGSLVNLLMGESGFNPNAQNPTSTAYGMFQFLNSTWATVGGRKTADPMLQAIYGLKYIAQSYGTPNNAYAKWKARSPHWYNEGGIVPTQPLIFDQGGMLPPGLNLTMNGTGRPEAIPGPKLEAMMGQRNAAPRERPMVHIETVNTRDDRQLAREIELTQRDANNLFDLRALAQGA